MSESVYRALLIGNSIFPDDPHNLFELNGPVNDLALLRATLTDPECGLFEAGNVRLLPERTKRDITVAIEQFFRSAGRDDTVLLYYTGHGKSDEYDNLLLCARDTRTDSLHATGISDMEIDRMIGASNARRIVIILDCCHSGAFKGGGPPGRLKGSGRFLLTSSRRGELIPDAPSPNEPSPFTRHLVDALRHGVDHDRDGYVSVNEVYDHVHGALQRDASKQIPQRHFDGAVGDVALARRDAGNGPDGSPQVGQPVLAVSPESIEIFNVSPGEELNEILEVSNTGGGELEWMAEATADWIQVVEHETYCVLTLTPRPEPGRQHGAVHIRDAVSGGSHTVRVLLEVREHDPPLKVLPAELDFGVLRAHAECAPMTLLIHAGGESAVDARVVATKPEIIVDQVGDVVTVSIATATAGNVAGDVIVRTESDVQAVPVRAEVVPGPVLHVEPLFIDFRSVTAGQSPTADVTIVNQGTGQLVWEYGTTSDFVTINRRDDRLQITLDGEHGEHVGSIWIRGNGGDATVEVRAEVAPKRRIADVLLELLPTRRRLWLALSVGALAVAASAVAALMLDRSDDWSLASVAPGALEASSGQEVELRDVTSGPGLGSAVAVGKYENSARVWTFDGAIWSLSQWRDRDGAGRLGTGRMNAVAVRGEMAIAVGLINYSANDVNGMIWRMSGDDDWARSCSRHICGGEGRQEIHAVAQISASRLIAVGRDAGEGDFDAAVWLSDDDGETWERVAKTDTDLGGAGNQVLKDVAVITGDSGNRLLAVGGNRVHGAVWMSNDNGDDWKRVFETRANAELLAVAQQGARVIAVGREGGTLSRAAAWISDAPASQWTQATVQEAQFVGQQMVDVVLGPDELVAVGNATRSPSEAAIWGSTDGIDWAAVSSDSFGAPSGMTGVTMLAGGPLFAVGVSSQNGRIWVSSPQ